jgi:hypothetical protein
MLARLFFGMEIYSISVRMSIWADAAHKNEDDALETDFGASLSFMT